MDNLNPWDDPPRTASWRRLVAVVVPLVVATACPGSSVGTDTSTEDSGTTNPDAAPTAEEAER